MPPKRVSLQQRTAALAEAEQGQTRPDPAIFGNAPERVEIVELEVGQVMPNPQQPRTRFEAEALQDLASSIGEHGVISPIIVKRIGLTVWEGKGRRYEIVAGERRWRATMLAGRPTIPAIIRDDLVSEASLELALIENLQRQDLTPLEEARAFQRMNQELRYSYEQIGKRIGKSKGYVQNRVQVLQYSADIQALVEERPDTLSHAMHLAKVTDVTYRGELIDLVRDGLSVAETRKLVQAWLEPKERESVVPESQDLQDNQPVHVEQSPTPQEGQPAEAGEMYLRKYESVREPAEQRASRLERDVAELHKIMSRLKSFGANLPPEERQVLLRQIAPLIGDLEALVTLLQ